MAEVPADGTTLGEIMLRGNTVMKGYLKNPTATAEAFRGDWYHTGDLAVRHPDGYVEVKDRSKDIIISGGENISSLEVEEALYRHPAVMEAAVVAMPDERYGERPCAFVTLKAGADGRRGRRSSPGAASGWPTSRRRAGSCSARCPRPRPARSRSSSCASARGRSSGAEIWGGCDGKDPRCHVRRAGRRARHPRGARPPVPRNAALIQIGACGVCGTDLHILKGHWPKPLPWPFTLGHEIGGVIVEKGDLLTEDFMGKPLEVGSRVMIPPLMPCGRCHYCVHYPENANKCLTPVYYGRYLGFDKAPHLWGGWAEHVYVDLDMLPGTKIYKLPDDMPLRLGALAEPLTSCIRAFNRADPRGRLPLGRHRRDPGLGPDRHPRRRRRPGDGRWPGDLRRRARGTAAAARAQVRRRGHGRHRGGHDTRRTASPACARSSAASGRIWSWTAPATRAPAPRGSSSCATAAPMSRWASSPTPGTIATSWHRICTKDLNVLGSWAFTGNDLPLGVDMLYRARQQISVVRHADALQLR